MKLLEHGHFIQLLRLTYIRYSIWENVVISGWILDPEPEKMSKSKGNVITPIETIEKFGADGKILGCFCD